jgi:hypothetical protein
MLGLPHTTVVNRLVPKNAFDAYINTRQKKLLSTCIDKIRWTNKLSKQTLKLDGKDVQEIQVFTILIKHKDQIEDVLTIIDKHIPYPIIFVVNFSNEVLFSASQKHLHPSIDNMSVIDWRFMSDWFSSELIPFELNLKNSLDDVYTDFCFQLSGHTKVNSLQEVIRIEKNREQLIKEIEKLESEIKRCKQFNIKVELNMQLQAKRKALNDNS